MVAERRKRYGFDEMGRLAVLRAVAVGQIGLAHLEPTAAALADVGSRDADKAAFRIACQAFLLHRSWEQAVRIARHLQ